MKKPLLKRFVIAAGLVVTLLGAIIAWEIARNPSGSIFLTPPSPNGYEDFLKAAQRIAVQTHELTNASPELIQPIVTTVRIRPLDQELASSSPEILRRLVQQNQAVLASVRSGIERECSVPLQFTEDYLATRMNEVGGFKTIARLLAAEGAVAEDEGRRNDALRSYLDAFRFGQASAHGGLAMDVLVAEAIQAIGSKKLQALLQHLNASECRDTARILSAIDDRCEPAKRILQRERAFFTKTRGLVSMTWFRLMLRLPWMRTMDTEPTVENSVLRGFAKRRLLIVELALQNYKLEHGQFPNRLAALVPNCLNTLPADPFTGRDFVYRIHDGTYRVYSLGPDRVDDGGKPLSNRSQNQIRQGDIVLD